MGMAKASTDPTKKKQQVLVLPDGRKAPTQASLKIYKTTPIMPPISTLPPPKKSFSKDKIDRNKVLQICVVLGNTHIYDNASPDFSNTFAKMESFKALDDSNPAGLPRFRTKIDMGGFADNEVSFECDGKKLIITGNRPKKNLKNARKVVEVLELPAGVFPEKLRVARDREGVLNIEERWTVN
jgi:HSP20 family molecular chaperone IbpA